MLSFKEESAIKIYQVQLEEPEKAQEIINEVLGTAKSKRVESHNQLKLLKKPLPIQK